MLTRQLQLHYITQTMRQQELPALDVAQFTEPYRTCFQITSNYEPDDAMQGLTNDLMQMTGWDGEHWPSRESVIHEIAAFARGPGLDYHSLEELADTLPPVEWLWKGWIPRGLLTLMGAVPGAGKSYLALDLCRRLIQGGTFPDGSAIADPGGPIIYVDAEFIPQIHLARARAWEMDISNVYMLMAERYGCIDLSTERDRDALITMCHLLQPKMVIVDSLSSITVRGENAVEDVRAVLSYLAQLSDDYKCAVLLIHHLRKRSGMPASDIVTKDDFRGSSHIVAVSRSVIGLSIIQDGPETNLNGPRQMQILKTNLGAYPKPIGVTITPLKGNPDYAEITYGKAPQPWREPNQVEMCAQWLVGLWDGDYEEPLHPAEILDLGADQDYSRATIYRARELLGDRLVSTGAPRDPTTRWGTPEVVSAWHDHIQAEVDAVLPPPEQRTQQDRCSEWLLITLQGAGQMPFNDLRDMASQAGYSKNTLYRAKDALNGRVLTRAGVWSYA